MADTMRDCLVAVCFFGISYEEQYDHWFGHGAVKVDYSKSLTNYRERIFSLLPNHKVYLSTYSHDRNDNLIRDLNSSRSVFVHEPIIPGLGGPSCLQRNQIISHLQHVIDPFDWYIFTRFDLHLNFNVDELDIRPDKINVLSSLENSYTICDNFYIVPASKIDEFFGYMRRTSITYLNRHDIDFFGGGSNLHLMRDEPGNRVDQLTSYKIIRG